MCGCCSWGSKGGHIGEPERVRARDRERLAERALTTCEFRRLKQVLQLSSLSDSFPPSYREPHPGLFGPAQALTVGDVEALSVEGCYRMIA